MPPPTPAPPSPYRDIAAPPSETEGARHERRATIAAFVAGLVPLIGLVLGARFAEREAMLSAVLVALAVVEGTR